MKLWLLRPVDDQTAPWNTWENIIHGFVVRAEDEAAARHLAAGECCDEGPDAWLEGEHSVCVELNPEGSPCVILEDAVPAGG